MSFSLFLTEFIIIHLKSSGGLMSPKKVILAVVVLLVLIFVVWPYTKWKVKREFNYHLDYKGQVEDTVREMVPDEYLKPEYRKNK